MSCKRNYWWLMFIVFTCIFVAIIIMIIINDASAAIYFFLRPTSSRESKLSLFPFFALDFFFGAAFAAAAAFSPLGSLERKRTTKEMLRRERERNDYQRKFKDERLMLQRHGQSCFSCVKSLYLLRIVSN